MQRAPLGLVATLGFITLFLSPAGVSAQTAPSLGSAQSFAVLAGSTTSLTMECHDLEGQTRQCLQSEQFFRRWSLGSGDVGADALGKR